MFVRGQTVRPAETLGIAVVMLDVRDCSDPANVVRHKALYLGYGFAPLVSNSLRLFLPMTTVRTLFTERSLERG